MLKESSKLINDIKEFIEKTRGDLVVSPVMIDDNNNLEVSIMKKIYDNSLVKAFTIKLEDHTIEGVDVSKTVFIDRLERIKNSSRIDHNYEPKRNYRFTVNFPEEFNIDSFLVKSITMPTLSNGTCGSIEMKFMDVIGKSISQKLYDLYEKFKKTLSDSEKGIFSFEIAILDPVGAPLETWKIDVETIKSINYGTLDYSDDGISEVIMVVQPKSCVLLS